MNVGERTAFAEIEEVAIIEKQLCDDVVGACVHFRFEVIHFDQSIWRGGMSFGETGHSNSETAVVRMRTGLVESCE